MTDERLVRLIEKGVLEVVVWESMVECGKGARLKCWQPVVYSHAILAAWGTRPNLYYSFADHDEYLAMPYPDHIGSVQDIITMCSDGQTQVRAGPHSMLPWGLGGLCASAASRASGSAQAHCSGRPAAVRVRAQQSWSAWVAGGQHAAEPHSACSWPCVPVQSGGTCCIKGACSGLHPGPAQRATPSQVNLRRFKAFCGPERCSGKDNTTDMRAAGEIDMWSGAAAGGAHPMSHYTLRSPRTWQHDKGKCIVHVDHMAGYQARASLLPPSVPEPLPLSCLSGTLSPAALCDHPPCSLPGALAPLRHNVGVSCLIRGRCA